MDLYSQLKTNRHVPTNETSFYFPWSMPLGFPFIESIFKKKAFQMVAACV